MTTFPDRYREVSVTDVDVPLEAEPLRALLTSRPVYRRTRYMVVRRGGAGSAGRGLQAAPSTGLFCDVADVELLAGPGRDRRTCTGPTSTPACPATLARPPRPTAPGARCVVVEGALRARQLRPGPAPRCGCTSSTSPRRGRPSWSTRSSGCSTTAEDLPGVAARAPGRRARATCCPADPAGDYLLPCRGGGMEVPGRDRRLPRRGAAARGLDAARLRPVPGHPRLPLRRPGARRSTPCPRHPGRRASTCPPARCC